MYGSLWVMSEHQWLLTTCGPKVCAVVVVLSMYMENVYAGFESSRSIQQESKTNSANSSLCLHKQKDLSK